jgi:hypothetical protein
MTFLISFLHESKNKKRFVYKTNGILKETEAIRHRTGTGPAPGPEQIDFSLVFIAKRRPGNIWRQEALPDFGNPCNLF